ncbi:hypothetical protein AC057_10095 [Acinetobacter genomosp. 33YU]|uniref:glycoside hydrolase family 24 protein n=1 Tax=Acinetobacter genomosp. 33YU TaxID=1675530 RepID=UPI00097F9EAF|nr:glycoside hydrolase family 104 protein [Acinetobacter genomosp. 33YU]ONN57074.1 hypothetical protein AC057_10095 [Acinetobacter genomosp. 33YU]
MATRENFEKLLGSPNVQKMLDLIANAEGVQHGYNTLFGNERLDDLSSHPNIKKQFKQTDGQIKNTTAAGRYQFLSDTWNGVAKQLGLKDFSPKNQDIAAVALLAQNGALPSVLKGDFRTAVQKSGSTWASLPSSPYAQPKKSWKDLGISNPARDQYQSQASKIVAAYKQKQKEQEAKAQPQVDTGRAQRIVEAYQKAQMNNAATQPEGLPDFDANGVITDAQVPVTQTPERTLTDQLKGIGEAGLTTLTGATTGTLGMLGGTATQAAREIAGGNFGTPEAANRIAQNAAASASDLTYAPRTQAGQDYVQTIADVTEPLAALTPATAEIGLAAQAVRGSLPQATIAAQRTTQAVAPIVERATQAAQRPIQATQQAISSGVNNLRDAVGLSRAPEQSPAANMGAMQTTPDAQRLALFDDLNVTPATAQVSRNQGDLAEMHNMARSGGESGKVISEGLERQQRELAATIDDMIERTGAQSTNFYATGGKINDALNTQFKVEKARVNKQYQQVRDSEGAKTKVDLSQNPKWSEAELSRADEAGNQLDTGNVFGLINDNLDLEGTPVYRDMKRSAVKLGIADEDARGQLIPKPKGQEPTVNMVENWRQRIGQIGNDANSIDVRAKTRIKKLIDNSLDNSGSNAFKQARKDYGDFKNSWTNRAIVKDLIEMKKGANNGDRKVIDEKIVDRITSTATSQDDLEFIKKMITKSPDGQQAWKDLQGTVINHIRNEAFSGADDSGGNPALLASRMSNVIEKLDGHTRRLDTLLEKQDADRIRDAGMLAKILKTVPENTGVNWSNTINAGLTGLFDLIFVIGAGGLPLPIATLLRQGIKHIKDKKQVARANIIINSLEKSNRQSGSKF